jgi:hypothetical protein
MRYRSFVYKPRMAISMNCSFIAPLAFISEGIDELPLQVLAVNPAGASDETRCRRFASDQLHL